MSNIGVMDQAATYEQVLALANANLQLVAVLEALSALSGMDAGHLGEAVAQSRRLLLRLRDTPRVPTTALDPEGQARAALQRGASLARRLLRALTAQEGSSGAGSDTQAQIATGLRRLAQASNQICAQLDQREPLAIA